MSDNFHYPYDPDLAILLTRFIEECESKYSEMPHDIGIQLLDIIMKYLVEKKKRIGSLPFEIQELNYLLFILKETKYNEIHHYPDLFVSIKQKLDLLLDEAVKEERIKIDREITKSHNSVDTNLHTMVDQLYLKTKKILDKKKE